MSFSRLSKRPLLIAAVSFITLSTLTAPASAATVFASGFETGNLSGWTGSAAFTVQSTTVRSGAWAGMASSTGAPSQAWKTFTAQPEVWADTWFNIRSRSTAVWLVAYRKAGGGAILLVGLDGQGRLIARNVATSTTFRSTVNVAAGTWHALSVHLRVGSTGRFDVSLDGSAVTALSRAASFGSTGASRFAVGDPNSARTYRVAFDDVRVATDAGTSDAGPPTQPMDLAASVVNSSTVDLAWDPSTDDIGVARYDVFRSRDGAAYTRVGSSVAPAFRDGDLAPGTRYWWAVEAVDAAGHRSPRSEPVTATTSTDDGAARVGRWGAPIDVGVVGVHAVVLHTGKVLLFYRTEEATRTALLLDPTSGALTDVSPPVDLRYNMFCSAHVTGPDGQVFIAGGLRWGSTAIGYGTESTAFFDPVSLSWRAGPSMSAARWYPTVTTLPDGDSLVVAGDESPGVRVGAVERLDAASRSLSVLPSSATLEMSSYPRMFVLPDGRMIRVGQERRTLFFDPTKATWAQGPDMLHGARIRGSVILLPGLERILAIGGAAGVSAATTRSTEILDLGAANPSWRASASMSEPRRNFNAVLLPDGQVFAIGGNRGTTNYDDPVLTPELFDPRTETWSPMAPHTMPRAYHSTAVLLPDGRVLSAGQTNGAGQTTVEMYSPPYLFAGPRPVISGTPSSVSYGASFQIQTADAATIDEITLIRPGTVSHGVDFDQRSVALPFTRGTSAITVRAPPSGAHAPPGWYMLFAVRDGVPSMARWVNVS